MATFFEKNPQRRAQWNPRRRNGNYTAAQYTIHSFEANVGTSALAGATILCTRPDPGSYHWLCDANGGYIHLAPWSAETWHSAPTNNWAVGGSIMMRAHQWRTLTDKQRRNIIHGTALGAARFSQWLISQGRDPMPARHLTRAQAMRKEAGFIFHRDTDPGRRSDPANPRDDFPWDEFYAEYHRLLGGANTVQEDDMPLTESEKREIKGWTDTAAENIVKKLNEGFSRNGQYTAGVWTHANPVAPSTDMRGWLVSTYRKVAEVEAAQSGLVGAIAAMGAGEQFDEAKLLAGVRKAAQEGVSAAIDSIDTTVTINREN